MADDDQDESQKTEEPTRRKLDEALKKGQVAFSRELTSFLILLALALNIVWASPVILKKTVVIFRSFIEMPHILFLDYGSAQTLSWEIVANFFLIMMLPISGYLVAAFASSLLQNGIVASVEPIIPKLEKISIFKGIKRLFSMKSFVEFLKGILKISLVAIAAGIAVYPELGVIHMLHTYSIGGIIDIISMLVFRVVLAACIVMAILSLADVIYQRFEYVKSLRMSQRDIKEEFKQSEGNPEVKAKLRQIRMERAQKRMMSSVPNADVVITNPTHFSIALSYDPKTMRAPVCVAKGQDHIALKIRELAKEHDIPLVENKPLARALFDGVEIDGEVPTEHYQAVAEIISYVYKIKGKQRA